MDLRPPTVRLLLAHLERLPGIGPRTAQRLADLPLTAIYSSPLRRAARTAQIISEPQSLTVQTLPGLGSMNYGDWAASTDIDVAQRWPMLYQQWRRDPFSIQVPGGEKPLAD